MDGYEGTQGFYRWLADVVWMHQDPTIAREILKKPQINSCDKRQIDMYQCMDLLDSIFDEREARHQAA